MELPGAEDRRRWRIIAGPWATVVKLKGGRERRKRREATPPPSAALTHRTRTGRGGFTGGVYEIGALRALDLLAVNRTVNQFDVYVGTSAGAFVASLAANGVTPEEMMRS